MNDLKFAFRQLVKNPGFTAVAVLTLGLGIGANTALFSLINAMLMRPLPGVVEPEGLVRLTHGSFSYAKFEALKAQQVFAQTVAFDLDRLPAEVNGALQSSRVMLVSGDYFHALGVNARLGRTITPQDDQAQALVAVLSHSFWTHAFAADPGVIGRSFRVSGLAVTIIGVTPPEFGGVVVGAAADFTMPVTAVPQLRAERSGILTQRSAHWLQLMGRLAPGQTLEQANARLQVVWPQVLAAAAPPDTPAASDFFRQTTDLQPAGNGFSNLRGEFASPLFVLMCLVGLVLLVACANVANLLLARGAARQREFAVRLASGASRRRLMRQLLTESVLLSVSAAFAGVLFSAWSTRVLVGFISSETGPVVLDLRPDWRVLVFSIGVIFITALMFGLAPALRATRIDLASSLKERSRTFGGREGRLRKALLVSQVAMAMVLAVGAGLFMNSFRHLLLVNTGFDSTNVLLVRADAISAGHRGPRAAQFFTELLDRVNSLPGVQSAAMSWAPPVSRGFGNNGNISVEGHSPVPGEDRIVWSNFVSPGYFGTIGQTLLAGRDFTTGDRQGAPGVAIINQSMARYFFGDESPVGRKFDPGGGNNYQCEIIGVVRDATHFSLKESPQRVFYLPYAQGADFFQGENMVLTLRSAATTSSTVKQVREVVAQIDRDVLVETETLKAHVDGSLARERLLAMLSGFLGTLSLLLAAIGLYGVMAYSVTRRTGEIGLRMALGAQPVTVLAMVLREGFMLVVTGTVIGAVAACAFSHVISTLLFGITARDSVSFGGAVVALTLAAVIATILPARRAAKVEPMEALRYE